MPGQHNNATKEERSRAAIAVAEEMRHAYEAAIVGTTQEVLFEEKAEEFAVGHTPNYLKVYVKSCDLHNQILPVRLLKPFRDGMMGEFL